MEIAAFLAEVCADAWLMEPTRLEAWLATLVGLEGVQADARPAALVATAADAPELPFDVRDGVAHVRVSGTLLRTVPWWARSATSTSKLIEHIRVASEDRRVKSVLLRIDSPGGSVSGIGELADAVYAARQHKPVHAHIDTLGASAAYWVGSQASRLTAEPTAEVGSIGAYRPIVDSSGQAARYGVKVHLLKSGPFKGVGFPGVPVTEAQLEQAQGSINDLAGLFVDAVARGRNITRDQIEASANGGTWIAAEAHRRGLIDGIEHADAAHRAVAQLSSGGPQASPLRIAKPPASPAQKGNSMETSTNGQPAVTAEAPQAAPVAAAPTPAPAAPAPAPTPATATAADAAEILTRLERAEARAQVAEARAQKAEAEAAAVRASIVEVQKARKADVLDGAIEAGRVAPANRELWDAFAASVANDNAGIEELRKKLAALPRVTRATAIGANVPEPEIKASAPGLSPEVAAALRARGTDPDRIARGANVQSVNFTTKEARLKDGRIVPNVKDYLEGKIG